ncbi:MAG: amidohydrolase [Burkholderiaceae bacterium]|nr:amidohydrolase [Burkholderiaceae bacterium]
MTATPSFDIVDIHPHVISGDTARFPLAPLTGEQSAWSRERPVDTQSMLAAMDAAGIAQSALVQASTCYGHDNSYVAAAVSAHPARFAGVFSVDVLADGAPAAIDHWLAQGLSGLRVFISGHTTAHKARLDDPRSFPAWQHASERGIPVCVQLRADGLPQLQVLLERFPDVRIVLDHFARPALAGGAPYAEAAALFALARHRNLYMKWTTHNVRESAEGASTPQRFLRHAIDAFGADRIAWGSNFPASAGGLSSLLQEALAAASDLTAAERVAIFSGTARALYPSLRAAAGAEVRP